MSLENILNKYFNSLLCLLAINLFLYLHTENNGEVAQLVRASDS